MAVERDTAPIGASWEGYATWDTWAVVTNLTNTEQGYEACLTALKAASGNRSTLVRILKQPWVRSLMMDDISWRRVDWDEVAEAIEDLS